jgi:hypothetical protein
MSYMGKVTNCAANFTYVDPTRVVPAVYCNEFRGASYKGDVINCMLNYKMVETGYFHGISSNSNAINCTANYTDAVKVIRGTSMIFYGTSDQDLHGFATNCIITYTGPVTVGSLDTTTTSVLFEGCSSSNLGGNTFIAGDMSVIGPTGKISGILPIKMTVTRYGLTNPNIVGPDFKINGIQITEDNMYDRIV